MSANTSEALAPDKSVEIACQALLEHGFVWDERLEVAIENALKLVSVENGPTISHLTDRVSSLTTATNVLSAELASLRARCDAAEKLLMECSDHGRFYYSTRTKSNGRYCDFVDRLKAFTAERAKEGETRK